MIEGVSHWNHYPWYSNGFLVFAAVDVRIVNEECEEDEELKSGRVEVSFDSAANWGTICDDYWDDNDAT